MRLVLALAALLLATAVQAQTPPVQLPTMPHLQIDPFWPKDLPNTWILGQVSGVAVDREGLVWIVHRPGSLSDREVGATQRPPWSKCCVAAPPVLAFDAAGNVVRSWAGPGAGYEGPEVQHGIPGDATGFVG